MAIPAGNIWEIQTGGSDTLNSGGFDPTNANMATDGAATSATSTAPVFTSASYNFVAGDVGNWLYIKSGTNWTQGWYLIASVATNAATLTAGIGTAVLASNNVPSGPSLVAGCATTASPTSATWSVDYSQKAGVQFSLTGLTTAAANAIILTASATKAMVGNGLVVTGGTNFTTGYYSISSVSAAVSLTVDRTCTSAAGVSGTAGLGGAIASPGQATSIAVMSNFGFIKNGTYSVAASISIPASSTWTGYTFIRTDFGTQTVLQASASSVAIFKSGSATAVTSQTLINLTFDGNNQAGAIGYDQSTASNSSQGLIAIYCRFINAVNGIRGLGGSGSSSTLYQCEVGNNSGSGITSNSGAYSVVAWHSYIHNNAAGLNDTTNNGSGVSAYFCIIANNSGNGATFRNALGTFQNCIFYVNGASGILNTSGQIQDLINCIFWGNALYGVNGSMPNMHRSRNIAAGSNTSGNFLSGSSPDSLVALTVDPFINGSGGNFALNNTAGGGAACRGAGFPGVFPGGTSTGYLDIGAVQHQDANPPVGQCCT